MLLCGRMAGTMIQLHCNCSPVCRGRAERCSAGAAFATAVSIRFSGRTDGPLWIAGSVGDYRRQFERTTRTVGEDPVIFCYSTRDIGC